MDNVNIKDVHKKILEIIEYFDTFCRENDITYYLMGGSALGAVRHKGFIPWDDDLDVFMTYDNYIKFLDRCEKYLDTEKFYLQKENTKEWPMFFSKLRMNNTTFIEEDTKNRNMHQGFFIDIMCLNNTSNKTFIRYVQYIAARLLTAQTLSERGYITTSKAKKITMFLTNILVRGRIKNTLVYIVRRYNNKECQYVGHFFGRAKFNNTSFPKSYLGKQRYVQFENIYLPVCEKVEDYLQLRFGDKYMDIPNKEIRDIYPVHAVFVDINKGDCNYVYSDK